MAENKIPNETLLALEKSWGVEDSNSPLMSQPEEKRAYDIKKAVFIKILDAKTELHEDVRQPEKFLDAAQDILAATNAGFAEGVFNFPILVDGSFTSSTIKRIVDDVMVKGMGVFNTIESELGSQIAPATLQRIYEAIAQDQQETGRNADGFIISVEDAQAAQKNRNEMTLQGQPMSQELFFNLFKEALYEGKIEPDQVQDLLNKMQSALDTRKGPSPA